MRSRTVRYLTAIAVVFAVLCSPTATATVPPSVAADQWCAALAAGDPVVDAMGDSLTESGSVAEEPLRWPSQVRDALRSDGAPNAQVWVGGAIGGSATADYVAGAKYAGHVEFTANHPDAILLGWGTNDWAASIPIARFTAQYQAIIDRIRTLSPGSLIVIEHMPWVYNPQLMATRGDQADYRDAERALAKANGAVYVGFEWPFRGDDLNKQNMPDQVHKNVNGQVALFATMLATLRAVCA